MRCVARRWVGEVKKIHGGRMSIIGEGGSFKKERSTQGNVSKQY